MRVIRALVVDDERPARVRLRRLLGERDGVDIIGEADGGSAAVAAIRGQRPDVVFLDVQMPGLDGFGVLGELERVETPHIVFVTAHDEFAVRAFEVHALDYLLKPVDPARLGATVERVRAALGGPGHAPTDERLQRLLHQLERQPRYLERIMVSVDERSFFVPLRQVARIESARNYVVLHVGAASYTVRGALAALEQRLDPAQWVRVNRSEVINLEAIAHLEPWFHGEYRVLLRDGTRTTWTRRYLARAEALLGRQF